jgi:sucrose phosphorylase
VQLIAYADRLGDSLTGLADVVRTDLAPAFGGVHILPFFTPHDGADAGFDPVDHTQVDSRLGSWDDVRDIARTHEVMVDLIVNHVSSSSAAFLDVREQGDRSPHWPMFLTRAVPVGDGRCEPGPARSRVRENRRHAMKSNVSGVMKQVDPASDTP